MMFPPHARNVKRPAEVAPRGGLGRTCPPQYFSGPIFQFVEIRGETFRGGGTMVVHGKNSSTDKQENEKDFQQINKEMKRYSTDKQGNEEDFQQINKEIKNFCR